jgi:hypothetical protein
METGSAAVSVLNDDEVEQFVQKGFVRLERAFPAGLADECRSLLWQKIAPEPDVRTTWTEPVVNVSDCTEEPFFQAANTPTLHEAFDQLVGPGRWLPSKGLDRFVIGFPNDTDPPDLGWHLSGRSADEGGDNLSLRSPGSALLMLFLFSDITFRDAPTPIRVGSHLDVSGLLEAAAEAGMSERELVTKLKATRGRPIQRAIGRAGDVYLCHPFVLHAEQPHHGSTPRFLAQPSLELVGGLDLDSNGPWSPVEMAIRQFQDRRRM